MDYGERVSSAVDGQMLDVSWWDGMGSHIVLCGSGLCCWDVNIGGVCCVVRWVNVPCWV